MWVLINLRKEKNMPGYKRKRKGDSWELEVTIGTDYRGRPQRFTKTVHCKNEREAEKELNRFYFECEAGNVSRSEKMTVSAFYRMFREDYCEIHIKPSTMARYDAHMRNQIEPYIGKRKLNSVKKYDIQKWINDLSASGLSPKTVKNTWSLLNTMYTVAMKWDIVSSNPCANTELPRLKKKEADYYSLEEVKVLLDHLYEKRERDMLFCSMLIFDLFTGLRLSELAGLKWSDVDWKNRVVHVVRQRQHISPYGTYESTPKTEKGVRDVAVPASVLQMLKELYLRYREAALLQGIQWTDEFYVISNEDLSPKGVSAMANWWRSYDVPGLRKITFHQLRHTHTAILAHIGVDKYDISDRLGHANFSTTLRTYMHILEHKDSDVADRLDGFIGNSGIIPVSK